jgi:hypothetical protein
MNTDTDQIDRLLSLRFIGNELEYKAVPIYELGQSLISIQRIVNKAYLLREGRLELESQLSNDEQRMVALQIGSRFKKSDGYGLIPLFTDPATVEMLKTVLEVGIKALSIYMLAQVEIKMIQKKKETVEKQGVVKKPSHHLGKKPSQMFISSIYNDVKVLTERLDRKGGIKNLEIALPEGYDLPPVNFSSDTKEYVRHLENQPVLGETQDISGIIERLDQFRLMAEVRLTNQQLVKVYLEAELFQTARYRVGKDEIVTFTGRPIMKLGARSRFKEFEAYEISIEKKAGR